MSTAEQVFAFGIGLGTCAGDGEGDLLEVWYPLVLHRPPAELSRVLRAVFSETAAGGGGNNRANRAVGDVRLERLTKLFTALNSEALTTLLTQLAQTAKAGRHQKLIGCLLEGDGPIQDTAEAYLKLHLLSLRHVRPNKINLDGIFNILPNVVWTSEGAIHPEELGERQLQARLTGRHLNVYSVDKFPRMANYVLPAGVRIADASRVRLGAYLGQGSAIMHEGFVNFNAGTLGTAMVEGRISQGVTVDDQSDLGGSASTMGTLSGGGQEKVRIGARCLIGANAGTGIPLGDDCVIEAGLYITAGTRVTLVDADGEAGKVVKARELAHQSNLLLIRNSETGRVECRARAQGTVSLNESLHAHN